MLEGPLGGNRKMGVATLVPGEMRVSGRGQSGSLGGAGK